MISGVLCILLYNHDDNDDIEDDNDDIFFFYNFFFSINFFYSPLRPRILYFICTVLQCDLPPLRPHCGEAPGRESNPGRVI